MKLAIIGGGASGLMAAVTAAELGHTVIVLERQTKPGRKLLASGNGHCNLTNLNASPARYHGRDAGFAAHAVSRFGARETLGFFNSLGLLTRADSEGRVYPRSNIAASVLDALIIEISRLGVELRCSAEVTRASKAPGGFELTLADVEALSGFDALIIAAGGPATPKLGGVGLGHRLLEGFGHGITPLLPALTQIKTDPQYPRSLKGLRADAALSLSSNGRIIARSVGEVQFTETGLSGICVFELARAAAENSGSETTISLDLMRDFDAKELRRILANLRQRSPGAEAGAVLSGVLGPRLGRALLRCGGVDAETAMGGLSDRRIERLAANIKGFTLPVRGTAGLEDAQVTAGGADTSAFDPVTLQSRVVPGLYACGEVLDIDGDCGGFNLQWAWSSGRCAGLLGG